MAPLFQLAATLSFAVFGVGLASAQLTSVILAEIPPAESGQASGLQSTFRQVGAAVGIALLGTILATGLRSGTEVELRAVPELPPWRRQQESAAAAVSRELDKLLANLL